ncbi:6-phosphogluconolactonase [Labedella phragmitis]|uniref:6-phosphogluconolactonase n=2 Tax=Labedella TaxID=390250 RepID=A0A3S3ZJJ2_9MICO|nr:MULTISPECIES: beta-propeller fold lactonase family protein [Labedella]RWZ51427.1 6-phosphogluconolactonase [Labedella phragmitis]RWZ58342.1 6-phosphogluconolactonase [Labedella populi]
MTDSLVLVANSGDGSISTFRLVGDSLERLTVTGDLAGTSTFVVDTERDLVYAGVKAGGGHESAGIVTLSLDRSSGALSVLSRRALPGGGMNYLALAREGRVLLGASYGGGYGISAVVDDGVVGEPVARIDYPNLHSVLPSADGRFAYFVSLGADLVAQYALGSDAALTPLDPPTVDAPSGSGPRHLVLNAAGDAVYVNTEFTGQVLHYVPDAETGTLELRGAADAFDPSQGLAVSRFGADPREEHLIWGADLHLADGGNRIWASERTAATLSSVAVAADGSLTSSASFVATEPQPRGFAISPDGMHVVVAGELSTTVSLYAAEGDRLQLLQRAETGRGANWVRFV